MLLLHSNDAQTSGVKVTMQSTNKHGSTHFQVSLNFILKDNLSGCS